MGEKLSTEPYKGTRDFYPHDMAVQRYIFDMWSKTAESFGFERYDASILEPSELYRSKTSDEIVREQTYSFIDRGEREVTLRPEMTPTVARMVSAKRRELSFPLRWYSIPNVFRYERPQKGRLREHWQFNCDIFGADHFSADVEIILLAHNVLSAFGATDKMFCIHINDRSMMNAWYKETFKLSDEKIIEVTRLVDRRNKMGSTEFKNELSTLVREVDLLIEGLNATSPKQFGNNVRISAVLEAFRNLGINNVVFDASLARGFDYYTGIVFEVTDTSPENKRAILGGGRYDNLTELFGGDPITGVGFGLGDVTMRDFLLTHALLPKNIHSTEASLVIIPTMATLNIEAERIAQIFRKILPTTVDFSERKLGKKIARASELHAKYIIVVGEDELSSENYILKNLTDESEQNGTLEYLLTLLT